MDSEKITKIAIDRFAEQLGQAEAVLFWQHLDENPSAKHMLAGLYQAGCDPLTLMTLAVLYCKGEELGVTESRSGRPGIPRNNWRVFPSACCKRRRIFRRSTKPRCRVGSRYGN